MSGITIRRGTPADLDQVMAMAAQAETAAHWSPEHYDQIFRTSRTLLVAEEGSSIIGFLIAHDIAGEWELENVVVAADHQRRGIGKRLLEALIRASGGNATAIVLEVRETNADARKLYESCGFRRFGRRSAYYSNPSEDAVLYRFQCNPESLENC